MIIRILVENTEYGCFKAEHGLCVHVEYQGADYMIDAGASSLFVENADAMGIDLEGISAAFLSHAHYDHSGGYPAFFERNRHAKVYLQEAAKKRYFYKIAGPIKKYIGIPEGMLEDYSDRFEYVKGTAEVLRGIHILSHSTPGIIERAKHTHMCVILDGKTQFDDFSHEQTVVFEEEDGLVCFNSCSHAGVDVIIDEVKRAFPDRKIKAFVGGFHMMGPLGASTCSYKKTEVQEIAEKLMKSSDAVFYSGHCTGTVAFEWLKEVMGERLQAMSAGKKFEI